VELGWGASSKLSTTTLSLKPSQTRFHSLLQIGHPPWWSMHDIFICKIVGLCMIFFHSWNCDIAHDFSFENLLVNNAFFIFYFFICQIIGECVIFFLFAQLLVNVWFFFHLLNCDTTHDFFICRILGHMHHFFITKNCWWWWIHDFFHLKNCWSMQDFYFIFIVELWYRITRWQQKGYFNVLE